MRGIEISYNYRNSPIAKSYIALNGITHFLIWPDPKNGLWSVWEMTSPDSGWVITCESKDNAIVKANKMCELTGLTWSEHHDVD